jgi:hypothetical protein
MISLLIPTRRRRGGLEQSIQSALRTASNPESLELIAYVDQDDAETYADFNPLVRFIIGPRIVLSNTWNKCAEAATGNILGQMNDDVVFQTQGWDNMVETAFANCADKILMVHGSDGSGHGNASGRGEFGPHPFTSHRWYETLGYFTPPWFSSDYGDSWINDLANAIGRRKHLPFVIEHLHHAFGKAEIDQTTKERLDRHSSDQVEQLYRGLAPLRQADVEKLKAVMQ